MKVIETYRVGTWEIEVVEPSVGGVGVILRGPRGVPIYLPPVVNDAKIEGIPRYLFKKVRGLKEFRELVFS